MNMAANVEIHFHQQDQVSVFLETNVRELKEAYLETLVFCLFSSRELANLGRGEAARNTALVLQGMRGNLIPFLDHHHDVRIVQYQGARGRKRFEARLRLDDLIRFNLNLRGFGLLGTGLNYYGFAAVFSLLRFLAMKRRHDEGFIERLEEAAANVGDQWLASGGIGVTESHEVGMFAATQAYDDLLNEIQADPELESHAAGHLPSQPLPEPHVSHRDPHEREEVFDHVFQEAVLRLREALDETGLEDDEIEHANFAHMLGSTVAHLMTATADRTSSSGLQARLGEIRDSWDVVGAMGAVSGLSWGFAFDGRIFERPAPDDAGTW
ncbi:MAG: hypothetical protein M3O70_15695, partial [Actinomycetota bacterium]|nr:hypothetical protein [Actinomycetota bacterium]